MQSYAVLFQSKITDFSGISLSDSAQECMGRFYKILMVNFQFHLPPPIKQWYALEWEDFHLVWIQEIYNLALGSTELWWE